MAVRVKVVQAGGTEVIPGVIAADPAAAQPHFEKLGWMEEAPCPALGGRLNPKITLDDGNVVWGMESWWDYCDNDGNKVSAANAISQP